MTPVPPPAPPGDEAARLARLARLSGLADALEAQPPGARQAWLDALPAADADLRALLAGHLAGLAEDDGGDAAEAGTGPAATAPRDTLWRHGPGQAQDALKRGLDAAEAASGVAAGSLLGPWRLIEPIGRGGMGEVWRAERTDGAYLREVALKLPLPSLGSARLAERFARERDILAGLAHPHIARFYDAGVSAHGQPWLVLELAPGQPITRHADAQRLGVRARIGLLLQVLGAVQHAHNHLVVHRDLKPGNIHVGSDGQVHLLDFGIARLLDDSGTAPLATPDLTEAGSAALTPTYAAPEQVLRQPVATSADLYALGVVLYELLTGASPYRPARPTRAALEEAILHDDPLAPSRAVTAEAAALRGAMAPALRRALAGDLDAIVLKALAKAPADRYASADAMAQDLQRWLDGQPVQARPVGWPTRLRKLVARRRLVSTAIATAVLGLLGGAGVALWQADVARAAARRAEIQAERAQAVQRYLIDLFEEADPARAQGREVSVRALLAAGERPLADRLAQQPEAALAIRGAMVGIYRRLGDEAHALPLAQGQVAEALRLHGPRSAEHGQALRELGEIQFAAGQLDAAIATLDQAMAALDGAGQASARLGALVLQAQVLRTARQIPKALGQLESAMPALRALQPPDDWPLVDAQATLASLYVRSNRSAEAQALSAQLLPLLDRQPPARAVEVANTREALGNVLTMAGDWAGARQLLERARDDFDRLKGPRNSSSVSVRKGLRGLLGEIGDYAAAATLMDDTLRRAIDTFGPEDDRTTLLRVYAVTPYLLTGRVDDGLAQAREAVRLAMAHPDLTPSDRRGVRRYLGVAMGFAGQTAAAAREFDSLVDADRREGHHDSGSAGLLWDRSNALRLAGRPDEAARSAAEAVAIWGQGSSRLERILTGQALLSEAMAWAAARDGARAQARFDAGLALLRAQLPAGHVSLAAAGLAQAEVLRANGQADAATRLAERARQVLQQQFQLALPAAIARLP